LLNIYKIILGLFSSTQKIYERGVVEENSVDAIFVLLDLKKRTEGAEVDADITILQTQHMLRHIGLTTLKLYQSSAHTQDMQNQVKVFYGRQDKCIENIQLCKWVVGVIRWSKAENDI
jgi:hypothetical protein